MRIVFMGTPDFAVASLKALVESGHQVVAVITAPDKPAGRGHHLQASAVKIYAQQVGLKILQPEKLKNPVFLEEYYALQPDLNVVVAFRMLPKEVWNHPVHGTFNLHASLLPQYRGAAPINRAIMNGETETGATTFFINEEIDTGKMILQYKTYIKPDETAGELHDDLMINGAELVVKTVNLIKNGHVTLIDQSELINNQNIVLKTAPKIFKDDCLIHVQSPLTSIYNLIRGLSPYPAAIAMVTTDNNSTIPVKIYSSHISLFENTANTGVIATDGHSFIAIEHPQGRLYIDELQMPGKKRLPTADFLRGFKLLTGMWELKPL